jgi:hypothetical protein
MRSLSRIARGAAAGTALGCLVALVTACGPASPSAGGGTTTGHVSSSHAAKHHPTATPSPRARHHHRAGGAPPAPASTGPGNTGSAGSTGSAGTDAAPACQSGDLSAAASSTQGTAGSVYASVTFTNRGSQACTLYGYPGVSMGTGSPFRQVGPAAAENPSPPRELVTLPPGGVASAVLQVADAGNYSSGQCRPEQTSELQVYPPNQRQALYTPYSSTGCAGAVRLLVVSVVQPGRAPQA